MSSRVAKHLGIVLLAAGASACDTPETSAPGELVSLAVAPNVTVSSTTDLGTFGMDHGFGFEINDAGNIAGRTETGVVGLPTALQAVFWFPQGGVTLLPTLPGGGDSDTRALNNSNLVTGFSQKTGDVGFQHHPVVWRVSLGGVEITELGPFFHGQAEDVNDRGVVVGWYTNTMVFGPPTGFRWSAREGLTGIPPVAGTRSTAVGINNGGDIVGSSTVPGSGPAEHAVVWWRNGQVTDIGTLGFTAQARSINDLGEVAGFGRPCPGCPSEAFFWSEADGIIPLGTFGGAQSFSFEIDNRGRVTGRYDTGVPPMTVQHAFVWTKVTGKLDLPSLGGPGSATGSINARGQTTGWAEDGSGIRRAVIWQLGPGKP